MLTRVDASSEGGFGFEGAFVRPGSCAPLPTLQLLPQQRSIVVLECAGNQGKARGHRRVEQLYILWSCDLETGHWTEIARALSTSWQWALELRPLAIRALKESRGAVDLLPSLPEIAARISAAFDRELSTLEARDQVAVLSMLHDQLASRSLRSAFLIS